MKHPINLYFFIIQFLKERLAMKNSIKIGGISEVLSYTFTQYQFWKHDNKPIELWSNKVIGEKINYVHENPVEAGLVFPCGRLQIQQGSRLL